MDKILQLMHDTMSPVATIKGAANLIKSISITENEKNLLLNTIEEKAEELNKILDNYYRQQRLDQ